MTLKELLLSICYDYPENLSDDVCDREVVLKIESEKLNCDVELGLDYVYNRNHSDGTPNEIVFEFTDK